MPRSRRAWRLCSWACALLGSPGVHQAKMIEFNLWNKDFPLPYQGDFMPAVPHIADPLRPG